MMNWCNPSLCMCRRIWSSIEASSQCKKIPQKSQQIQCTSYLHLAWCTSPSYLRTVKKTPQKAQKKEPRLISAGEENSRTLVIRCESRPGPHKESDPLGITFVHSPLSPYLTSCLKQNSAPISEFL